MKLKKILNAIPLHLYRGNKEIEITGLSSHSKFVHPGNLFIAKRGGTFDGSKFIDEAIQNGAVAVLSENPDPFLKNVVGLTTPNIRAIEGKLATFYYGHPSSELLTIGVTGTCGKTTITYLLRHLLRQLGKETGLIGSIEYCIGQTTRAADRTTPDVIACHKMLREMVKSGCTACTMEVCSHGLDQGRVDEIDFDVGIFTNLSHDHLDYHKTMEKYAEAKALLFTRLKPNQHAIVNCDSPWWKTMVANCQSHIITYGFSKEATVRASAIQLSPQGTKFDVTYKGEIIPFSWSLIGNHNVMNALAAIGALLSQNIDFKSLPKLFSTFQTVPGRLERVEDSSIFVDYAHKPDALRNVLSALLELKRGKLITVFGCGGDRDQLKRPEMARVAEEFSDLSIVTSDNPRTEDPLKIIDEIKKGFSKPGFMVEPDRKKAIELAIKESGKEDIILIAGKGHENYQIFAHRTIHFDDREVASEIYSQEKKI
jgi:UDP-N-acetylmuramoyl-L-alanyl-D-glutamate--2,6-diaminopimelate ligase